MFPATEERTLVTFALFAYNLEKYIRKAVEGAFAQSYEPMEIILSDDCSTDRTFEIMQEMARTYSGTKKNVVRQTHSNMGTFLHVVDVASIAQGGLIVLAAGDDISKKRKNERNRYRMANDACLGLVACLIVDVACAKPAKKSVLRTHAEAGF